jgi:hypothetical protein
MTLGGETAAAAGQLLASLSIAPLSPHSSTDASVDSESLAMSFVTITPSVSVGRSRTSHFFIIALTWLCSPGVAFLALFSAASRNDECLEDWMGELLCAIADMVTTFPEIGSSNAFHKVEVSESCRRVRARRLGRAGVSWNQRRDLHTILSRKNQLKVALWGWKRKSDLHHGIEGHVVSHGEKDKMCSPASLC